MSQYAALIERLRAYLALQPDSAGRTFHAMHPETLISEAADALSLIEAELDKLREALTKPDAERRLWFISDLLASQGYFNRADICEAFGVSVPQASADIGRWLKLYPGAASYDTSTKRYRALHPTDNDHGDGDELDVSMG